MDTTAPRPRLCHLRKWPDFVGYGFNLHAEKGRAGQYIGKVDEGSPAEAAGLKEGDRIVEVNGVNIGSENHHQVVQRIKSVADEVKFLVVDEEADRYYREKKIIICGSMDNVLVREAVSNEHNGLHDAKDGDTDSNKSSDSESHQVNHVESHDVELRNDDEESWRHRPRLCELVTWSDFSGFGFELSDEGEHGRDGHFIASVEIGSPAAAAGLRDGDRIVEVNDKNVTEDSHQEVVSRVRSTSGRVTLLVVDSDADRYFRDRGIHINSSMSILERTVCPDVNPTPRPTTPDRPKSRSDSESSSEKSTPIHVPAAAAAVVAESHPHRARLCIIRSWKDGRGYGFSMQAQKGKIGHFIGKIDRDSPAEAAGLKDGDRIVEVNGHNVDGVSHKDVVEKIKAVPDVVKMLVVDPDADGYFKGKEIKLSSDNDGLFNRIECPEIKPAKLAAVAAEKASSSHSHRARLCTIRSWKDGRGYGFSMQAQKGKTGHYIGKVDRESPADAAGLKDGDRIVEVNGHNVDGVSHKDVVEKIKAVPDVVKMLVVDPDADVFFREEKIKVTGTMDWLDKKECSATKPANLVAKHAEEAAKKPTVDVSKSSAPSSPDSPTSPTSPNRSSVVVGGIEFAPSAEEARRRVSKKQNVKGSRLSMKEKYDLFQKL